MATYLSLLMTTRDRVHPGTQVAHQAALDAQPIGADR